VQPKPPPSAQINNEASKNERGATRSTRRDIAPLCLARL
jgi:hypothetical protein